MAKKPKKSDNTLMRNRKAFHDFQIFDRYEAGIELLGTEVKSCRAQNVSFVDSFIKIEHGEAFLYNIHIAEYDHGNQFNHEPTRRRKLLLHKREILKIANQTRENGLTIVPLRFYLARGKIKVEIGTAKGKKLFDKRDSLRKAQDKRDVARAIRHH